MPTLPPVLTIVEPRMDAVKEETLEVVLAHSVASIDNICCIVGPEDQDNLKELVENQTECNLFGLNDNGVSYADGTEKDKSKNTPIMMKVFCSSFLFLYSVTNTIELATITGV
jgi:hypothetical protein